MKSTKIIYPVTLFVFLMGTNSCFLHKSTVDKDGITLKYSLTEGHQIVVKNDVISKIESEQMGQSTTADMNSSTLIGFKPLSVGADGGMDMEMEFIEMSQKAESSMGSGDTDYSKLIGEKASFKLSGTGVTSDLNGFEELPSITNINGETITGDMYKQVPESSFFKLPDHPVKIGDSWTNRDSTDMPYGGGNLKTVSKTIYIITEKLVVDEKECFKIDVTGTAKTSGEFEQNGTQLSLDRTATSSGHVIFAYNKGMYLSMEITSKTADLIDVPVAGITITQTISSSTITAVKFK